MSVESIKKNCVCIQGPPLNWAWSLRELGAETLGPSAKGESPPSELAKKRKDQILWAFGGPKVYENLKDLVNKSGYVRAVLVTTKKGSVQGGIIGFGEIHEDDLKGYLKWDYWPLGTGWDYKFFIRVTSIGPNIANSLNKLKDWHSSSKDQIKQVMSIISEWNEDVLPVAPKNLTQSSMTKIDEKTYRCLNSVANEMWVSESTQKVLEGEQIKGDFEAIIVAHLVSGKNVIIYGPPGIGKTTLAKKICEDVASGYDVRTGNPEWTIFDVNGGRSLNGEFRFGFLSEAVVKCWKTLITKDKPYWLLIDEINRTNADLAFGEAFTTMDVLHRKSVPLLSLPPNEMSKLLPNEIKEFFKDGNLFVPYSFRIISTMNSYDRALLFKLGFALIRRFALIPMSLKPYVLSREDDEIFLKGAKALINETKVGQSDLYERAKQELMLSRMDLRDYLVIKKDYFAKLSSGFIDDYFNNIKTKIDFSPFELIEAICYKINDEMRGVVEIGKAFSLDASKFLIAASLVFKDVDVSKSMKTLVDEAVAAYIIPQLDVLSERVRAEKMGLYTDMKVSERIEKLMKTFSDMNLSFRTIPLLKKISAGERTI
jgi:hypothetical protein